MKIFETLIEVLHWGKIAASPTLIGGILGWIVYLKFPGMLGMILGVSLALAGLIFGIIWATRVWKEVGTTTFMSRLIATPELDAVEEK
ncbi:MAG: hypothetical protein JNJ58_06695 [Chitinophagaceae bacterium]|nr:hypothetical protein [Chitinophagaceae bacterium]